MDTDFLPQVSLRRELTTVLAIHAEEAERGRMPVLSPRGVLTMLNGVGPEIGERWLPLIEATLDALWAEGMVGRIPAPSPHVAKSYCSRWASERAILRGAPIILLPRNDGIDHRRRSRGRRRPRSGGPSPTSPSPVPDR